MRLEIHRNKKDSVQTLGVLKCSFTNKFEDYFSREFKTLELPDLNNKVFVSRVLAGEYFWSKRWSIKYGWHIRLEDKHGRTWILIHAGNFFFNTTGCILVGSEYKDINGDGILDLINSKKTLKKLIKMLPKKGTLQIFDEGE